MQRSIFKSSCSRTLILLNSLKSMHHKSLHVEQLLEAAPAPKNRCLDLLGRLIHGRLSLLGGRPVPPRFLPLLAGDRSLYFNADEDEEFRKRLAMQLKELRETLQEKQELREGQEQDFQELEQQDEEEDQPYVPRSREISMEDLTDEELSDVRGLRMSASQDDGKSGNFEQPETSELESEETADAKDPRESGQPREPQDAHDAIEHVREGEIEGVYWTGEGKRIVTQTPQRKTGHSGFIDGHGEEIPQEDSKQEVAPYHPEPRAQAQATSKVIRKGRKPKSSTKTNTPSDSDE
uniref:GH11587p n=1 Tax=Drosophila melanogaster TaxID=7227 RepID=Q9VRB7_DROME|nr:uncharacterized protein Dmel_CG1324, isoform C [Drosophila melanogaster]NP_608406.1 uncharacterized protein Dmel_CG1324, isoform A [Drosophila melanogaster]AAF50885.1 uncharacterized protein Dmel_CG1324, isoform A [Drosophila melanogaster]AAO42665.1 GH11587p [Drosophila melanogaster]AHN59972.1 uncharacterized protein Dmel_CG1324, isoform C [Drosophila melanogaster]|eukprot:NP_001285502.1 uncharacterized protein Dmel_CG1324, isoform C [Drosophila melanogaster]